jgi:hypothetical protein
MTEPGTIADLPLRWHHDDWKSDPLSWSRRGEDRQNAGSASAERRGDSRAGRDALPLYQSDADRVAAEAVEWDQQRRTCLGLPDAGGGNSRASI